MKPIKKIVLEVRLNDATVPSVNHAAKWVKQLIDDGIERELEDAETEEEYQDLVSMKVKVVMNDWDTRHKDCIGERTPMKPPKLVQDVHTALASLNPSAIEEFAGGVWDFKLPSSSGSEDRELISTAKKLVRKVKLGGAAIQLHKSPYSTFARVIIDTETAADRKAKKVSG